MKKYFVYITTNKNKTVLYTGVTNNIKRRMEEHYNDSILHKSTFAGKYNCYHLIYFEEYTFVNDAINREKEIKLLKREKKKNLINIVNPKWEFYSL